MGIYSLKPNKGHKKGKKHRGMGYRGVPPIGFNPVQAAVMSAMGPVEGQYGMWS